MTASHVYLVGFMASGKSTVGRILAGLRKEPFLDLDQVIEDRKGKSIPDIFREEGEDAFREAESLCLAQVATGSPSVVATGGGVVLDPGNWTVMERTGRVVYLETSFGEMVRRLGSGQGRPVHQRAMAENDPLAALRRVLEQRIPLYRRAQRTVATDGRSPDEVATEIQRALGTGGQLR
jgi:shikimate kinase